MSFSLPVVKYRESLKSTDFYQKFGKVTQVVGLVVKVEGLEVFIGEVCEIFLPRKNKIVQSEVVGFIDKTVLLMPLDELDGIGPGCLVEPTGHSLKVEISDKLLGKTLDGLGRVLTSDEPVDGDFYEVRGTPPDPFTRQRISQVMRTGVRSIDGVLTVGEGQRMGIFAGSGVGKSTLLGMLARNCDADVIVIGLIGERGREVAEFIENDLGPAGYQKSVIVCATSDQPPLVRLKGAFVATAIAEHFRDQGKKVVLMMDSVTRFALAQREIGLATGEPPTTKGYTPSVFTMLPKLLERSGMSAKGSITAFYTVLVEGDDMNEPIADAVRGILDGHIVLSRKIAAENHYPAIDIQQSLSRLMKSIVAKEHQQLAGELKENMAIYAEAKDLIDIGAYKHGSNLKIDRSLEIHEAITSFLKQQVDEPMEFEETITCLQGIFN